MKIIPNRNMQLDGEHVQRGKAVDVSDAAAALALRHGWAVKAPAKAGKDSAPASDGGSQDQ